MLVVLKWKMCGSYVINTLAILPFVQYSSTYSPQHTARFSRERLIILLFPRRLSTLCAPHGIPMCMCRLFLHGLLWICCFSYNTSP